MLISAQGKYLLEVQCAAAWPTAVRHDPAVHQKAPEKPSQGDPDWAYQLHMSLPGPHLLVQRQWPCMQRT